MVSMFNSTIAAVSTPRGKGGIAVIRVSGNDAVRICSQFVFPVNNAPLSSVKANTAVLCRVLSSDGEVMDEAIVTVFHAPRSYTGEDTVEISCHGGILLTDEILTRTFECGAVQATAGEFTRRAFSAGKMTLSEAESVIGVIDAQSSAALRLARSNLGGTLTKRVEGVYALIRSVVSSVYAGIDFPDEDLQTMDDGEMMRGIIEAKNELISLADTYRIGHAVCDGIPTAICGKPNTGKSSILNLLLGEKRAIVTDIPGTTRDMIRENAVLGDVTLNLRDTAGIRETADAVEKIGIDVALEQIGGCELILAVFDGSRELDGDDDRIIENVSRAAKSGAQAIALINKRDCTIAADTARIGAEFAHVLTVSAFDGSCRGMIADKINELFVGGALDTSSGIVTTARQHASVLRALDAVRDAERALSDYGADTAGSELERAMAELGELDGREIGADIVDSIFHKFCVGK